MTQSKTKKEQLPIPLQIVRCSTCEGWGHNNEYKKCPQCAGHGIYAIYNTNKLLYIGYPHNPTSFSWPFVQRLYLTVIVEWVLKLLALAAPLVFILYFWRSNEEALLISEQIYARTWLNLIFWGGWIAWLIIFYWTQVGQQNIKPLTKLIGQPQPVENPPPPQVGEALKNLETIDISQSFSYHFKISLLFSLFKVKSEEKGHITALHTLYQIGKRPYFQKTLGRLNIEYHGFLQKIQGLLDQQPKEQHGNKIYHSPDFKESLFYTLWFLLQLQEEVFFTYSILLGLIRIEHIYEIFQEYNVKLEDFQNTVFWTEQMIEGQKSRKYYWKKPYHRKGKADAGWTSGWTMLLNQYSQDLTSYARDGYLLPVVGRQTEIESLLHILDRVTKSHALLVGEVGVGKSSVVNGLAQRIVGGNVPFNLKNYRVVSLNIAALFSEKNIPDGSMDVSSGSGTSEILSHIMHELAGTGEVILVLEDIHLLFSSQGQGMNAFAVMRPFVENNVFKTIGITDPTNYKATLEMNETFASFFQVVKVDEPNVETAIHMVKTLAIGIERAHGVVISYPAVEAAVKLSHRYIKGKALPSKAIDLLDEAAVVCKQKEIYNVNDDVIIDLVTKQTGIPVQDAGEEESKKLLNMEVLLHDRVIGQEEAVKAVSSAMRRARSGLKDETRPIATFLFMGPTGVGKTELSKALADVYFGSERNIIRLDMSEYQNANDLFKLIGSPPGSADTKAGGYLTEAVRQAPFSLVLLDELEKANPKVWDIFLQVFDDGRLTDSRGITIDFTHTIIISTSNVGALFIQQAMQQGWSQEQIKEQLLVELQKTFRPEFINRYDGVILFKPLDQEQLYKIAQLMINSIKKQLALKEINLEISPQFLQYLVQKGYHPQFGARPLRRVIQEEVENLLADKMLRGEVKKNDTVVL
ncbi:MAG: ATP-dependent Clp protease ATP-binding subunit [bacterium]